MLLESVPPLPAGYSLPDGTFQEYIPYLPFILSFCLYAMVGFMAILFVQSGMDKVMDWKGNLGWLQGHFGKSFLKGMVPMLLGILTLTELVAGIGCGVGGVLFLLGVNKVVLLGSLVLCQLNFLMLFFGQRVAKDYAGAAGIVPYFLTGIVTLLLAGFVAEL